MKKKVLALIMAGTMALSMATCGNTQSQDTPKEPEKQETVQTEGTEEGGATDVSGITADSFKPSKDFNVRVPFARWFCRYDRKNYRTGVTGDLW
ncbi:MAG: hypothetical protein ACLVCH_06205 [Roseburia inulinivorans]